MESVGVGKKNKKTIWAITELWENKIHVQGALCRFHKELLIAVFLFVVFLFLSFLVSKDIFTAFGSLKGATNRIAWVHQVRHLPCEWTMTETPGWAFHTQWGMAAGKTCTCGQQLCWQPRSHRRALLRRSLAENTHSRTHRNQTGISCLPRQVLIKTAKPFFSSSPLPFSAEVRRLREKRKTREEKKRVRRFLPHHPASFPGSYIICVLFQMKLTMHKYLPAKNNNNHTCCKHCLNVLCWGKKKEAANVAGCRYRRRICGIATFPGKLLRNFQTDGEESNLPLFESGSDNLWLFWFSPTRCRQRGRHLLKCKSCFEWLKPDGRLFPPQVTAALTHWVTLCFWYPSSCCGFPPWPLRSGGCLICEALGSSLGVFLLRWFLVENAFLGVEHQWDVVRAKASTSCWRLAAILFSRPVVVFHSAVVLSSSERHVSYVTAAPKKASLIHILDGI